MGRYTGPVCRLCRRMEEKLFLKGERCFTRKCAIEQRRTPPGSRRTTRRRRLSDHALQLREKQKARYMYGLMEYQFRRYVETARTRPGTTGQLLLQLLEQRLDNVVFRLGFADSRKQARQIVGHRHITVNGRNVNIPSYRIKVGDEIGWRPISQKTSFFEILTKEPPRRPIIPWLTLDTTTWTGKALRMPDPAELETSIDTRLIVEFYSKR